MSVNSTMEFLKANYCQTTTQFVVNSNTTTVENILNPDKTIQYYSESFNNDLTTVTMTISFDSTLTVSRIALLETNLKGFTIFYNGATANTFPLTSTGSTVTSSFSANSETALFLRTAAVACTSVSIDMKTTQVANSEKAIGYLVLSDTHMTFSQMPSSDGYNPKLDPEQVVHNMSDGGVRIHTIKTKNSAEIRLKNISRTFRDSLKSIFDLHTPFMFCPFGTTTSWDEILFECVWPGNFDFYKYSSDAATAGFSGTISLRETAS